MAELPIHPQGTSSPPGHEAPAVALERRRQALSERGRASTASILDELRQRTAVETLLLTGDASAATDAALVEAQLAALRELESESASSKEPSLALIRAIHRRANPGADGEWRRLEQPGQFQAARPSAPAYIEAKLDNLNHWLSSETGRQMFATERMALWFARFLEIAPFERGNFRTAHLFLTFFAASDGFPPVTLARADADVVRQELERAMVFDTAPLVARLTDAVSRALQSCEEAVEGES